LAPRVLLALDHRVSLLGDFHGRRRLQGCVSPHLKEVSDYHICVADHGLAACSNGIPFEEAGPHLPSPYVPYVILGVIGPLAILFAGIGVAWIREEFKIRQDDSEA
jgi:hypothetical protein